MVRIGGGSQSQNSAISAREDLDIRSTKTTEAQTKLPVAKTGLEVTSKSDSDIVGPIDFAATQSVASTGAQTPSDLQSMQKAVLSENPVEEIDLQEMSKKTAVTLLMAELSTAPDHKKDDLIRGFLEKHADALDVMSPMQKASLLETLGIPRARIDSVDEPNENAMIAILASVKDKAEFENILCALGDSLTGGATKLSGWLEGPRQKQFQELCAAFGNQLLGIDLQEYSAGLKTS